jgi:hypothetical protein
MAGVPSNVGVFFGQVDKRPEGWYWTETAIDKKAVMTGPFETKEQAVEHAVQSIAARQGPNDQSDERGAA